MIRRLPKGKAAGPDEIPNEALILGCNAIAEHLSHA
jgi:hypothetical protein